MTDASPSAEISDDLKQRMEALAQRRAQNDMSERAAAGGDRSGRPPGRRHRRHAAKGSRVAALALSLATMGGLTAFFQGQSQSAIAQLAAATATADANSTSDNAADTTVTGDLISTRFGPVQVQATFAPDGSLSDVEAVLAPGGDPRTDRISQIAVPLLNQEALSAQSARVDTISGASYTSNGYMRSLQSAIDLANAAGSTPLL